MTVLKWSGTFNNDRRQVEEIYNQMDSLVKDINKLFDEARSYWIDDNDPKGKKFKEECVSALSDVQKGILAAQEVKNNLFNTLDTSMKNINEDNSY